MAVPASLSISMVGERPFLVQNTIMLLLFYRYNKKPNPLKFSEDLVFVRRQGLEPWTH